MRNLLFVLFALVLIVAMGNAQVVTTGTAKMAVTVINGLTITPADGNLDGLTAGYTYTLSPDINAAYHVFPIINGGEDGVPMQFAIAGGAGLAVELTFELPKNLIGSTNAIPCSFSSTSLMREEDGALYNPNAPVQLSLGNSSGAATLDLGITVAVPINAIDGDEYDGYVVCSANVIAL